MQGDKDMNKPIKRVSCTLVIVLFLAVFHISNTQQVSAAALTVGDTYTITIDTISSSGALVNTSLTTTAVADSDAKISFSLNGVPTTSSCNFMVVNVKDSSETTVRKSIVPCPAPGSTLPLGVSGLTEKQTDALISALASAGTDDPILAIFGFTIVRSDGITSSELATMANICYQGISGTNGFVDYLTNNGVSTALLATYRSAIIAELGNETSGYCKLYKDSIESTTSSDELDKRGEAAALLLNILVTSATTAGFSQDKVLEAFNAMGAVAVPLINQAITDSDISTVTGQMVNSTVGGGIQKLKAEKSIAKYTASLTSLGASGTDVTQYQNAANTLSATMVTAFKLFEQVFTGTETDTDIASAESTLNSTMSTAFNTFMTATAATNSRINTMIANIDTALGSSTGLTISDFQIYKSDASTSNWSITMVIPTDWISTIVGNGGALSYTRDSTAIPATMVWIGTCSNSSYFSKTDCEGASATWTTGRTDFVGQGTPASYATLLGLQEDVMILEFSRWDDQGAAGSDMSAHATLEKNFAASMSALAGNVTGTTDDSTAITSASKTALVTLIQSPQF